MCYYEYMLRQSIAYITLFMLIALELNISVFAIGNDVINSLDDLPYADAPFVRESLLMDDISLVNPIAENTGSVREDEIPKKEISLNLEETIDPAFAVLLGEKRIFDAKQEILTPSFITDPFTDILLSRLAMRASLT